MAHGRSAGRRPGSPEKDFQGDGRDYLLSLNTKYNQMHSNNQSFTRRNFLKSSVAASTMGVVGGIPLLTSCSSPKKTKVEELQLPALLDQAPDGKTLKAGLIGCGGRGTGAAIDFLNAGPNLEI